jgi:hypothetical protein
MQVRLEPKAVPARDDYESLGASLAGLLIFIFTIKEYMYTIDHSFFAFISIGIASKQAIHNSKHSQISIHKDLSIASKLNSRNNTST